MKQLNKDQVGLASLALTVLSFILGFIFRTPLFNTFTLGTWLSLVAFVLSLCAVQDHGNNALARHAFWLSFLVVCITIFIGSSAQYH